VVEVRPAQVERKAFEVAMHRFVECGLEPLDRTEERLSPGEQVAVSVRASLTSITGQLPEMRVPGGHLVTSFIKTSVGGLTDTKVMQLRIT
jgi:hypothetical protein